MEMGIERSVPGLPHSQLPHARPERRNSARKRRGSADCRQALLLRRPGIRNTQVFELPFPYNNKKQEGFNSFAQFDWIASSKHLVTATIHVAPQRLAFVNMNFFNPQPTTPDASTHNYTATLADRLSIGSGLLESTFSATRFDARVWGQGSQDLMMTPAGNSGSYFAQQDRNASRLSLAPVFSFGSFNWLGTHNFKVGSYMAESTDNGQVTERPIDILNSASQLIESIGFTGGQPFRRWDTEYAFFGQDHWIVTPRQIGRASCRGR